MATTFRWGDLASARAGGRPLSNMLRFLFISCAFGAGSAIGEILLSIGA